MGEDGTSLRITAGGRERVFSGAAAIVVGREPACAVPLDDPRVSRRHLVVERDGDGWVARDNGSRNGTWHDGARITRVAVSGQLALRLGNPVDGALVELVPLTGAAAAAAEAVPASLTFRSTLLDDSLVDRTLEQRPPRELGSYSGVHDLTTPTVTIGRSPKNDIVVDDLLASRRHAVLRGDQRRGYELEDLGSQNGTFVNGQRIRRARLDEDDVVTIGRYQLRLAGGKLERYVDTGQVSFEAFNLTTVVSSGTTLLDDVSFALRERSFMAIVGPSGCGKTTLLNALTGARPATSGSVLYGGRDLYDHYEALRHRIGYVPQDDVLHPQLTVRRALEYAAELRFEPDVSQEERQREVEQVLEQLGILGRADLPIHRLSGGQRKRASIALELLTRPSLLILDEPTSGLDPGIERVVMQLLRRLADEGRTVIVVTHSVQSLDLCDHVLFMALGGKLAYFGPPREALPYFDEDDYPDVFSNLGREGGTDWQQRFRAHPSYERHVLGPLHRRGLAGASQTHRPLARQRQRGWAQQLSVLMRRYLTIIGSDRRNVAFLVLQALVVGALLLVLMPADHLDPLRDPALGRPRASMVILALILSITWIAASNSIREIVKERAIYRRERAFGLPISAYLLSKALVLGAITVVQAAALTAIALQRQGDPVPGVVLGSTLVEVGLGVVLAGLAAMAVGLFVSAVVSTADKALTIFPLLLIPQLVFAGPIFPVDEHPATEAISYASSAKWGFAAVAATVDLNALQRETAQQDTDHTLRLWRHRRDVWTLDMAVLAAMTTACLLGAWLVLWRRDRENL